eukprot:c30985_g1_i1 orf=161-1207(-)
MNPWTSERDKRGCFSHSPCRTCSHLDLCPLGCYISLCTHSLPSIPLLPLAIFLPCIHPIMASSDSSTLSHQAHAPHQSSPQKKPPGIPLKRRLEAGEQIYGAFHLSFSPWTAEVLGWAGYDFVVVDMEHGAGDTFEAVPVLQALAVTGTPAVLRVANNDPVLIKKALDLGPQGIMIPMVDSVEDATKAVAACRYPPKGIRGVAYNVVRASRYGLDPTYLDKCEDDLFIMVQIESLQAAKDILDIASVEGIDCVQIGPLDLTASAGFLRSDNRETVKTLLRKAENSLLSSPNKVAYLSGFAVPDDPPQALYKRGYDLVLGAVDVALFRDAATADIKKSKAPTCSPIAAD